MADTHVNRLRCTVSAVASAGLGAFTISAASSGYRTFGAAQDGQTFTVLVTEGTTWEVNTGCTYTHGTTSLARGTLADSSTGSAITFTTAAIVDVIAAADHGRRWDAAALAQSTVTGTSGAIAAEVNTLYVADMSGWTADRTLTLPATAAVGDRVGVMVSVGDDAYEWLIQANTGNALNGVTAAEWSRVFITGEVVLMRCVTANAAWVVEQDGRVPQKAKMYLSTAADGESASTYTRPTAAATPGAWTDEVDNASLTSTSNDRIYARRACTVICMVAYVPKDSGVAGNSINLEIRKNGTTVIGGPSAGILSSSVNRITAVMTLPLAAGDYLDYYYRTEAGGLGAGASASWLCTFAISEVLP